MTKLVCLHGFLGSSQDWEGLECVAIALPYGLDLDAMCLWLFENLKEKNILRCTLLGYSMGGRIALRFAILFPEFVEKLILVSTSPGLDDEGARLHRWESDLLLASRMREMTVSEFLKEWYQNPIFNGFFREEIVQTDISILSETLLMMSPGRVTSSWSHLSSLQMPVVVIVGEKDQKYIKIAQRMCGMIQNVSLRIVANVGHSLHLEDHLGFISIVKNNV